MNNYSQNNFNKPSKAHSAAVGAVIIIGGISLAGFVCGAASALLTLMGFWMKAHFATIEDDIIVISHDFIDLSIKANFEKYALSLVCAERLDEETGQLLNYWNGLLEAVDNGFALVDGKWCNNVLLTRNNEM
jgi:hypothetical protein